MNVYIVNAEHWTTPGNPLSVHFDEAAADAAALDLVNALRADLAQPLPPATESEHWNISLREAQRRRVVEMGDEESADEMDEDDLREASGGDVWVNVIEVPNPSVVVNISGGVMQGASATIPIDIYSLDFDDFAPKAWDVITVPSNCGGVGCDAIRAETSCAVEPQWVADVIAAPNNDERKRAEEEEA